MQRWTRWMGACISEDAVLVCAMVVHISGREELWHAWLGTLCWEPCAPTTLPCVLRGDQVAAPKLTTVRAPGLFPHVCTAACSRRQAPPAATLERRPLRRPGGRVLAVLRARLALPVVRGAGRSGRGHRARGAEGLWSAEGPLRRHQHPHARGSCG